MSGHMITIKDENGQLEIVDFASFGLPVVAYVKPVNIGGTDAFSLHAADGTLLSLSEDENLAAMDARKRNLLPVMVH